MISDANNLNPYSRFRAWTVHRRGGLYTVVPDPDTMSSVPYARERIFSVLYMRELLERNGFTVSFSRCSGYIPPLPFLLEDLAKALENAINKIPIFRLLGISYRVVARKV